MNTQVQAVDFTSFVFAQNDDIKTTSLIIAEKFSKSHTHVIRDIEKIMTQVSDLFYKTNFGLIEYETVLAASGGIRKDKAYELTKDGFIMVVMSYTGAKAFAIKESYINAFNLMHAKLFPKHAVTHQTPSGLSELLNANLTPLKKIMMLTLASQADENGQVQIGIHDLATLCGIARSTANESVIGLEKMGFLTSFKTRHPNGGSAPNTYVIPERFRVVSGELVDEEPAVLEYLPPDGMVLIDASELETLRHKANSKALPSPVQKVEPIPAGCVVLTLKEYDAFKKLDDIVSGIRFALNY